MEQPPPPHFLFLVPPHKAPVGSPSPAAFCSLARPGRHRCLWLLLLHWSGRPSLPLLAPPLSRSVPPGAAAVLGPSAAPLPPYDAAVFPVGPAWRRRRRLSWLAAGPPPPAYSRQTAPGLVPVAAAASRTDKPVPVCCRRQRLRLSPSRGKMRLLPEPSRHGRLRSRVVASAAPAMQPPPMSGGLHGRQRRPRQPDHPICIGLELQYVCTSFGTFICISCSGILHEAGVQAELAIGGVSRHVTCVSMSKLHCVTFGAKELKNLFRSCLALTLNASLGACCWWW